MLHCYSQLPLRSRVVANGIHVDMQLTDGGPRLMGILKAGLSKCSEEETDSDEEVNSPLPAARKAPAKKAAVPSATAGIWLKFGCCVCLLAGICGYRLAPQVTAQWSSPSLQRMSLAVPQPTAARVKVLICS